MTREKKGPIIAPSVGWYFHDNVQHRGVRALVVARSEHVAGKFHWNKILEVYPQVNCYITIENMVINSDNMVTI